MQTMESGLIVAALARSLYPDDIKEDTRNNIAKILYALRNSKHQIKLVLVTTTGIASKSVNEESLIGLEMEAKKQAALQEQAKLHIGSQIFVILD
jgi:hypothetical protein